MFGVAPLQPLELQCAPARVDTVGLRSHELVNQHQMGIGHPAAIWLNRKAGPKSSTIPGSQLLWWQMGATRAQCENFHGGQSSATKKLEVLQGLALRQVQVELPTTAEFLHPGAKAAAELFLNAKETEPQPPSKTEPQPPGLVALHAGTFPDPVFGGGLSAPPQRPAGVTDAASFDYALFSAAHKLVGMQVECSRGAGLAVGARGAREYRGLRIII
jgi:hypothetical protein